MKLEEIPEAIAQIKLMKKNQQSLQKINKVNMELLKFNKDFQYAIIIMRKREDTSGIQNQKICAYEGRIKSIRISLHKENRIQQK